MAEEKRSQSEPYETYEEGLFQSTDATDPMSEGDFLGEYLETATAVSEQHVYHHSAAREPYGNLSMGKTAKGDRTFTIEIKGVTPENFDQAVALREKLHLEAVKPDPEPVVETISLGDLVGGISLDTLMDEEGFPEDLKLFSEEGDDVLPPVSKDEADENAQDYFESAR